MDLRTVFRAFNSAEAQLVRSQLEAAGFIVFVAVGGYACWRWPRFLWLHLPAVAWSVPMQILGWTCPLTPLENLLLALAGGEGYGGGSWHARDGRRGL